MQRPTISDAEWAEDFVLDSVARGIADVLAPMGVTGLADLTAAVSDQVVADAHRVAAMVLEDFGDFLRDDIGDTKAAVAAFSRWALTHHVEAAVADFVAWTKLEEEGVVH